MNYDIIIYSKNNCVKCKMTKNLFTRLNTPFSEINLEDSENEALLNEFRENGYRAMPIIRVFDKNTTELIDEWTDFQDKKVKQYAITN